jgi:uncharacterized membrane protein
MTPTANPPGWNSNPSAWHKRVPSACLAAAGLGIAVYLTLFQYGVFGSVWDPFFGNGSRTVLTSSISTTAERWTGLPIKDAALGALAYLVELIADLAGGSQRWRTSPWIVAIFAAVAVLLGGAGLVLVLLQALVVQAWCTLCLASAAISLTLLGLATPEAWATIQHVKRQHAHGHSWWRTLWGVRETTP